MTQYGYCKTCQGSHPVFLEQYGEEGAIRAGTVVCPYRRYGTRGAHQDIAQLRDWVRNVADWGADELP